MTQTRNLQRVTRNPLITKLSRHIIRHLDGTDDDRLLMAIRPACDYQVLLFRKTRICSNGFRVMGWVPAFDAVNEVQHMFLNDLCLLCKTGGQASERGAVGVVGVGQHQDTAGISYEFRGFGQGERIFRDVTPDQVFIEGLLPVRDNASGYQDAFIGVPKAGWFDDTAASGVDEWNWDEDETSSQLDLIAAQEQNGTKQAANSDSQDFGFRTHGVRPHQIPDISIRCGLITRCSPIIRRAHDLDKNSHRPTSFFPRTPGFVLYKMGLGHSLQNIVPSLSSTQHHETNEPPRQSFLVRARRRCS